MTAVAGAVRRVVRGLGMRRDRLQQVERAEAVDRQPIPQSVVAAGPDHPHVPARNGLGTKRPLADSVEVHIAEVVGRWPNEVLRGQAGTPRLVVDGSGLGLM